MNDDALFDDPEVVEAQARADIARRDVVAKALGPGAVYQGVSKSIRVLTASGTYSDREAKVDSDESAGLIALARATARTIDRMTGHNPTGWTANGRDLAPLVEQLRQTLEVLIGEDEEKDALLEWLTSDAPVEATP